MNVEVLTMLKNYFYNIDNRIILMDNNLDPKILKRIKQSFDSEEKSFDLNNSISAKPEFLQIKREISRLSRYFKNK